MASPVSTSIPTFAWDDLSKRLEQFLETWNNGREPTLAEFLPGEPPDHRRLVLVELVKVDLEQARKRAADPAEAYYSSNIAPVNGRQIIIAVDQLNVSPSGVKPIMNAATQFLNRLTPLDSVAFVAFPEPGPRANFTTDRFRVRQAMQGIVGQNTIPAMDPAGYNNNVQIVQTSDYVVIHTEQVHDARIVPLDGRPHVPDSIRTWKGDARGHWEGDTLVVETTNYTDKIAAYELSTHRSARGSKGLA